MDRASLRRRLAACGLCLVLGAVAPTVVPAQDGERETTHTSVASAPGAILRGLDKLTGIVAEIDIGRGQTVPLGRLQVTLGDCRYPVNNPAGDAFAWLVIREAGVEQPVFQGWMVASSPALNPLEHPRYDVWVIRCKS
ncbi:DUF2155 domain-containing protein [Oceaniglobus roseus]|uniref:DUF2155 domain-containing protein n=1 Tax=Oceaniglobus roseus TaxID=1737570 RepID=UPI000C7F560B|nr:DUF2155 domain-containing protein [Kandeliimicrobium roseum]